MLFILLGALSCNIKEDMSDCPGSMILDYSSYSQLVLDDIAADEQIKVFIFDSNGICCDVRSFTYGGLSEVGLEFELPITYRGYNAVVWHGAESEKYESSTMMLGESYEDFQLTLLAENSNYSGALAPLWASPLEPIEYCAKITRHRVYMTRLHTEINITLQESLSEGGFAELDVNDYTMTIEAANNVYHTDYTISDKSSTIRYSNDGSELGTLRLTPDMECLFNCEDVDCQIDLIEYMLSTKTDSSISDQEFLDLNKVWNISLVVKEQSNSKYIALGIIINGWVRWFSSSELN
ncbi:MAG: FimB/Mfa2 family fimbrial subunit [Rikenellaceae bacterium]